MTSAFLYHVMHILNITIDIRNVCVFLAPLFSSLTVVVTYHLTRELKVREGRRERDRSFVTEYTAVSTQVWFTYRS